MAAMYDQLLTNAGYDVTTKLVGTRDIYFPELKSGDVDVVPEYLGSFADFLNTTENGPNAEPVVSNDPQEELDAVKPMADSSGITLLEPAEASDQNAFAVTKEFAKQNNLTTLSDLGELGEPITLAGAPDCKGQKDCEAGLENVYGIDIEKILPLGFGTPQTIDSATSGESQLAEVGTTQGDLDESGLVILEDDQGIQAAENLIPAINSDFLNDHPDVADVLNPLADVLTTEDLADLNGQVSLAVRSPRTWHRSTCRRRGFSESATIGHSWRAPTCAASGRTSSRALLVDVADDEEHRAEDRDQVGDDTARQHSRQHGDVVERRRPELHAPGSLLAA